MDKVLILAPAQLTAATAAPNTQEKRYPGGSHKLPMRNMDTEPPYEAPPRGRSRWPGPQPPNQKLVAGPTRKRQRDIRRERLQAKR